MLTSTTIEYLRSRRLDPAAERRVWFLPLAGIYWSDEIPDFKTLRMLPDEASEQVFRLMAIRQQIWNGDALPGEDQAFWKEAVAEAPDCPIFQRLAITQDDREEQTATESSVLEFFEALAGCADEVEIDQDGRFSARIDLPKDDRQPAWKRLPSWLQSRWG